jgi:hypothetical protein
MTQAPSVVDVVKVMEAEHGRTQSHSRRSFPVEWQSSPPQNYCWTPDPSDSGDAWTAASPCQQGRHKMDSKSGLSVRILVTASSGLAGGTLDRPESLRGLPIGTQVDSIPCRSSQSDPLPPLPMG